MKITRSTKLETLLLDVNARTAPRVAAALFQAAPKLPAVRLKNILATTDFSKSSLAGVRYAAWLANKLGAALGLVHVVERARNFCGEEAVALVRNDLERMELAERQLSKLAHRLSKKGAVRPLVRSGKAFNEIAAVARDREVDLVIMATHGYSGLKRILLGSTAERVVRHAPCPVLTIRSRPKGQVHENSALRLRKIIVPIDFSQTSAQALPYAAALARTFTAEIILLHVIEPLPMPADSGFAPSEIQREDRTGATIVAEPLPRGVRRHCSGPNSCAERFALSGNNLRCQNHGRRYDCPHNSWLHWPNACAAGEYGGAGRAPCRLSRLGSTPTARIWPVPRSAESGSKRK
jgi:nucleotide-binding universal stress UspA family protein